MTYYRNAAAKREEGFSIKEMGGRGQRVKTRQSEQWSTVDTAGGFMYRKKHLLMD